MPSSNTRLRSRLYAFVNAFAIAVVLLSIFVGLNWHNMPEGMAAFLAYPVTIQNILLASLILLVSVMAFRALGLSRPQPLAPLVLITKACLVASVFALPSAFALVSSGFTFQTVVVFVPIAIAACVGGLLVCSILTARLARAIRRPRDLVIVGSGPRAEKLYQQVCKPEAVATRVLGFVDSPNCHLVPDLIQGRMLGTLDDLEGILMRMPVDEVLIALPARSCYAQIQTAIGVCEREGVETKYLADVFEVSPARRRFEVDTQTPVVSLKFVQDDYRLVVKRCIDLAGAMVGLVLFAPVMIAIAAAIKLTNPGPVLFHQQRYGLRKRRFRMYKFRTMVVDAEQLQSGLESQNELHGPAFKIRNDPRITAIGRMLRKTSLDELPQFFNVLRGEMSLVGPRPLPKRDVARFDDAFLMRRFSVKPGITGLWQVSGRSNTTFSSWIAQDLLYIDTWSLFLDFRILVKTIPAVLFGTGAA